MSCCAEPGILTHLGFELCILVAQNHLIHFARPFDPRCQIIRIMHNKLFKRVAKPFDSHVAKPFDAYN